MYTECQYSSGWEASKSTSDYCTGRLVAVAVVVVVAAAVAAVAVAAKKDQICWRFGFSELREARAKIMSSLSSAQRDRTRIALGNQQ